MTVTLTREAFTVLEQVTYDCAPDGAVHDNYSGRHMYGSQCLALVCDGLSELICWMFGVGNAAEGEEPEVAESLQEFVELLQSSRTRQDSLGYQQVFYWPDVQVAPRG